MPNPSVDRGRLSQRTVSVLIPARNEEHTLPVTLPLFLHAADHVGVPLELLVITPPDSPVLTAPPVRDPRLRFLSTRRPGKFQALHSGTAHAEGDLLLLINADVRPAPSAFAALLAPLLAGEAEVAASRVGPLSTALTPVGRLLEGWSVASMTAWHRLRSAHAQHRWALPGALYALRRDLMPDRLAVPIVDDASIGLHADLCGARIAYVPRARVDVVVPTTYRRWVRQKLRSRRGWSLLAEQHPVRVRELERQIADCHRQAAAQVTAGVALRWQDHTLRLTAKAFQARQSCESGVWQPDRSQRFLANSLPT